MDRLLHLKTSYCSFGGRSSPACGQPRASFPLPGNHLTFVFISGAYVGLPTFTKN